jgi:hypothetical protein
MAGKEEEGAKSGSDSAFGARALSLESAVPGSSELSCFPSQKRALKAYLDDKSSLVNPDISGTGRTFRRLVNDDEVCGQGTLSHSSYIDEGGYYPEKFKQVMN